MLQNIRDDAINAIVLIAQGSLSYANCTFQIENLLQGSRQLARGVTKISEWPRDQLA
jgi:hypothetical protein